MMAASPRYPFEGQDVTPSELAQRFTCYGVTFLTKALKGGCQTVHDLARWYQQGKGRGERMGKLNRRFLPKVDLRRLKS